MTMMTMRINSIHQLNNHTIVYFSQHVQKSFDVSNGYRLHIVVAVYVIIYSGSKSSKRAGVNEPGANLPEGKWQRV